MEFKDPLTEEHLTRINDALQMLDMAEKHIAKARMAGVPVEHHVAPLMEARKTLVGIKSVYFPGR